MSTLVDPALIGTGARDAASPPVVTRPAAPLPPGVPVTFTGVPEHYFRVWAANLALTLMTLGIYSAWAKVRREKYFHQNTWLAGSNFDYLAEPRAILKGRIVVAAILIGWNTTQDIAPALAAGMALLGFIVLPWLIVQALRFRLRNTSFRGLRFRFLGPAREAAKTYLMWPILSFGAFYPYCAWRKARYVLSNTAFGTARFSCRPSLAGFFRLYYAAAGACLIFLLVGAPFLAAGLGVMAPAGNGLPWPAAALALMPLAAAMLIGRFVFALVDGEKFRMCFDGLRVGTHTLHCRLDAADYAWVAAYGMLFTVFTLGLYKPWMDIELTRLRMESISLHPDGDLNRIGAVESEPNAAAGDQVGDILWLDVVGV